MQNVTRTSDRVDVVRCKDCKKWDREWTPAYSKTGPEEYHMCYEVQGPTSADWFCADGERKEDDDAERNSNQ